MNIIDFYNGSKSVISNQSYGEKYYAVSYLNDFYYVLGNVNSEDLKVLSKELKNMKIEIVEGALKIKLDGDIKTNLLNLHKIFIEK